MSQKLHVLSFLSFYKIFDRQLFQNFIKDLKMLKTDSSGKFETLLTSVCSSRDPIDNNSLDHFNELLQLLDFYQMNVI